MTTDEHKPDDLASAPLPREEQKKWQQVGHPRVRGRCPSCGSDSLFLGSNGYVTCSVIGCKEPGAATDLLASAPLSTPSPVSPPSHRVREVHETDGTRRSIAGVVYTKDGGALVQLAPEAPSPVSDEHEPAQKQEWPPRFKMADYTAESGAEFLAKIAQLTARNSNDWDNFQSICVEFLKAALAARPSAAPASEEMGTSQIAKLRDEFQQQLEEWELWDSDPTSAYEQLAERFYRETGLMAPGKSQPREMYSAEQDARRTQRYHEWTQARKEQRRAMMRRVLDTLLSVRERGERK